MARDRVAHPGPAALAAAPEVPTESVRPGWWFDEDLITGIRLPGELPVDEVVFFILVPLAAILTLEAVRSATGLPVGDEEAPGSEGEMSS